MNDENSEPLDEQAEKAAKAKAKLAAQRAALREKIRQERLRQKKQAQADAEANDEVVVIDHKLAEKSPPPVEQLQVQENADAIPVPIVKETIKEKREGQSKKMQKSPTIQIAEPVNKPSVVPSTTPEVPKENIDYQSYAKYSNSQLKDSNDYMKRMIRDLAFNITNNLEILEHDTFSTANCFSLNDSSLKEADDSDKVQEEIAKLNEGIDSTKAAFHSLHKSEDYVKQTTEQLQENQFQINNQLDSLKKRYKHIEEKYLALKSFAQMQLEKEHKQYRQNIHDSESQTIKSEDSVKLLELQVKRLENELQTKTNTNIELAKISDVLLGNPS